MNSPKPLLQEVSPDHWENETSTPVDLQHLAITKSLLKFNNMYRTKENVLNDWLVQTIQRPCSSLDYTIIRLTKVHSEASELLFLHV